MLKRHMKRMVLPNLDKLGNRVIISWKYDSIILSKARGLYILITTDVVFHFT